MKTKQALKYQLHLTMKSLAIFFFLYSCHGGRGDIGYHLRRRGR